MMTMKISTRYTSSSSPALERRSDSITRSRFSLNVPTLTIRKIRASRRMRSTANPPPSWSKASSTYHGATAKKSMRFMNSKK